MKTAKTLPKILPGAVCAQWVKCGKPNCKCAHGELHGPYYYRFWRENGRLRKEYIPLAQVETVRAACEEWRQRKRRANEALNELREVRGFLRDVEQELKKLHRGGR